MAVLSKGQTFADGDDVTHTKLNNLVDAATFVSGSSGTTDDSTLEVNGSGRLQIKDSGVTTGKIGASAVTTAKIASSTSASDGVTFAKIQYLSDMTVIGNVSGGATTPTEISILDEDDMASDSDTALCTQQSIKAFAEATAINTSTSNTTYSAGTIYENTSSRPLIVTVYGKVTAAPTTLNYYAEVGASSPPATKVAESVQTAYGAGTEASTTMFIVPAGYFFKVTFVGGSLQRMESIEA